MFWRTSSPLDADDEEWQLDCWGWLLRHFGGAAALRKRSLILPTRAFFTPSEEQGHAAASHYFGQVAAYFGIDAARFNLVPQEDSIDPVLGPLQVLQDAPREPAGTFSVSRGGAMTITYNPAIVPKPMKLIATFAHEICHPLLFSVPEEPPGGTEMEEFATDLAVTFFGFGIFNSNTAASFTQYRDTATGTQGWSFERQGYLSPAERAFAPALFIQARGQGIQDAREYLDSGPLAYFRKATKYLAQTPSISSDLLAAHQ
ncbi:hypothetical protein NKH99_20050 [Mesorhizobium sp. M0854]|uniref:hypothetical protein n=1 Tax=Mesorhizobium sp. M0854 TaxID=2957013 RepID=UPI0033352339